MLKQARHSPDTHATRFDVKGSQRPIALLIVASVLFLTIGGAWVYFVTNEYGADDVEESGSYPSSLENLERE